MADRRRIERIVHTYLSSDSNSRYRKFEPGLMALFLDGVVTPNLEEFQDRLTERLRGRNPVFFREFDARLATAAIPPAVEDEVVVVSKGPEEVVVVERPQEIILNIEQAARESPVLQETCPKPECIEIPSCDRASSRVVSRSKPVVSASKSPVSTCGRSMWKWSLALLLSIVALVASAVLGQYIENHWVYLAVAVLIAILLVAALWLIL